MQAFLHGRNVGVPAENEAVIFAPAMPQDIAPGTVQPTEPLISFLYHFYIGWKQEVRM